LIAAALFELTREEASAGDGVWDSKTGWWLNRGAIRQLEFHTADDAAIEIVNIETMATGYRLRIRGCEFDISQHSVENNAIRFIANGTGHRATVLTHEEKFSVLLASTRHHLRLVDPFHFEASGETNDGRLTAMMPGRVVKVMADAGDTVKRGQALIIMEAMKMEHTIVSPREGVVERVAFKVGDMVPADAVLFAFAE
jgi:3-methylcrotonyl-CoA carboxylase alpha subunit